jgi:hypothetical protein
MKRVALCLSLVLNAPVIGACSLLVDVEELGAGCARNEKECNGVCVAETDPRYGCAAETCQPCALPNATSACSPEGQCFVASCTESFEDCNKRDSDGCEVNTDLDPLHCGGCDAPACEVSGAFPACAGGQCAIRKCVPGFKDCNRRSDDGCELPVHDDSDNCGACGVRCDAGLACVEGYCSGELGGGELGGVDGG